MAQDTVVGVLGALIIVGSMAGVIQALDTGPGDDGEVTGPPAPPGKTRFTADGCQALTLIWTPDRSTLDEVVGPRWTPARASTVPAADAGPDQGVFMLFGYRCPSTAVDGISRGSMTGGGALVPVQDPEDPRNVTADAWVAAPEIVQARASAIFEPFQRHRFPTTAGSVAVGTDDTPLGTRVRMIFETPDGRIEASAVLGGSSQSSDDRVAVVGTDPAWFSVMHGSESKDRRTTGSATVQTSGTTWVDELGLEPTPSQVAYDTGFSWDFTLEHEPWAGGNATASSPSPG